MAIHRLWTPPPSHITASLVPAATARMAELLPGGDHTGKYKTRSLCKEVTHPARSLALPPVLHLLTHKSRKLWYPAAR